MPHPSLNRRKFLVHTTGALSAAALAPRLFAAESDKPLKVAAVVTTFTHRSHAHVILENFLQPYLFNGQVTNPGMQVASLFVDQIGPEDMSPAVSKQFNIPVYPTIAEALTLGGKKLAVDAVLSIGEHGDYPLNEKGQMQYPRKQFFDQIVAVFKDSGRAVPVFNDKHLSYRWDWAKEMYDTSRAMNFPLMAGSSVPLAERRPPLELPPDAKITGAVSIHGGNVEGYDFHCLEVLESMIEARRGGETGVKQVMFLEGEPLWARAKSGLWSSDLAAAAMAAEVGEDHELTKLIRSRGELKTAAPVPVHGILLEYRDGLVALALKIGESSTRWNFACQIAGEKEPRATAYNVGPWQNRNLFKALSHAIQTHFRERKAPYPVERTLLVGGILDASMTSRQTKKAVDTPELNIAYAAQDFRALREMGASWKKITDEMPEPMGIVPVAIQ